MKGLPVVVLFLAVIATFPSSVHAQKTKTGITIHQEVYFNVAPQRLYQVLLNSEQFSACTKRSFAMFTASSAKIDAREGGTSSLFDGHIIGRILELVPGKRIVEAWRVVAGTRLQFDHIGFPDGLKEHLASGWQQHYWDALTKYFQGQ